MSKHHHHHAHHEVDEKMKLNSTFEALFIVSEIIVIIIYAICANYDQMHGLHGETDAAYEAVAREYIHSYYPMWQDVHVFVYIGFGFLMVYLKSGSW